MAPEQEVRGPANAPLASSSFGGGAPDRKEGEPTRPKGGLVFDTPAVRHAAGCPACVALIHSGMSADDARSFHHEAAKVPLEPGRYWRMTWVNDYWRRVAARG